MREISQGSIQLNIFLFFAVMYVHVNMRYCFGARCLFNHFWLNWQLCGKIFV